jgi:hypothetical protein
MDVSAHKREKLLVGKGGLWRRTFFDPTRQSSEQGTVFARKGVGIEFRSLFVGSRRARDGAFLQGGHQGHSAEKVRRDARPLAERPQSEILSLLYCTLRLRQLSAFEVSVRHASASGDRIVIEPVGMRDAWSKLFHEMRVDLRIGRQHDDLVRGSREVAFDQIAAMIRVQPRERRVDDHRQRPSACARERPEHGNGVDLLFTGGQG